MCRASQFWGALLCRKRTAAVVQYRSVQWWWIKMQNWGPEGGESHQAPLGRLTKAPRWQMRPAGNGGSTRRMTSTRRNNAGMRSAAWHISTEVVDFSPAPAQARNEEAGRKTKSSRTGGISPTAVVEPPLPTAGGGGGGVMSTGGEEARKLSAGRPLSAEAVEFSPASAREQHRRLGWRTMSIGTGGISPTQVA